LKTIIIDNFFLFVPFFSKHCAPKQGCNPQVRVDLELIEINENGIDQQIAPSGVNPNGQISSTPNGSTCVVNQHNHNELGVSHCLGNNNSQYNNDNSQYNNENSTAVTTYFAEEGRPVSAACV
jgi:hypothetical protein